jgi:hypothetical protein
MPVREPYEAPALYGRGRLPIGSLGVAVLHRLYAYVKPCPANVTYLLISVISSRAFFEGKEDGLVPLDCSHLSPRRSRGWLQAGSVLVWLYVELICLFAPNVRLENLTQFEGTAGEGSNCPPR